MTKGADSSILKMVTSGNMEKTVEHIHKFDKLGLRTLVVAVKQLDSNIDDWL
jgi:magnesium-transporting ATPase (P-type)